MDTFGGKTKASKKELESLDDLLGDLLEADETPRKKPANGRERTPPAKSGGKDDFYSNLAVMAEQGAESEISDADVGTMAKNIADLDAMDNDLFGESRKKKGSAKGNKAVTPRSKGSTPRSPSERVASPTTSELATSPPGSARGSLKRKPVKPTSLGGSTVNTVPPGSAPGKMTDLGKASEGLRPGQPKEVQRPGTVPQVKKYDFPEFDEDDPLAGLIDDDDSVSEAGKMPSKPAVNKQKSVDDESKVPQLSSPRKVSLFDRPPTRSGTSGTADQESPTPSASAPSKTGPTTAAKRKEELIFSDDDNFLDGLGIDGEEKNAKTTTLAAAASSTAGKTSAPPQNDEDSRPAKSVMDGLLGRGGKSAAASLLETKEKPKTFVLDKKYTQPNLETKDEEDFVFGSYQPSVAGSTGGNSRPSSRRSVRFQDDDDIFGPDKKADPPRSAGSGGRGVPDDMKWLAELTAEANKGERSMQASIANPSTPTKSVGSARSSSPIKKPESPRKNVGSVNSAKESVLEGLLKHSPREGSPERKASPERKPDTSAMATPLAKGSGGGKDWLGLKSSDSDEDFFIPRRSQERSPVFAESVPKTVTPSRGQGDAKALKANEAAVKSTDDEEEDSFITRAKARRQAALGSQAKSSPPASTLVAAAKGKESTLLLEPAAFKPTSFMTQPDQPQIQSSAPLESYFSVFPPDTKTSTPVFKRMAERTPVPTSELSADFVDAGKDMRSFGLSPSLSMAMGNVDGSGGEFQSGLFETRNKDFGPASRYDRFLGQGEPSLQQKEEQFLLLQQQQRLQQLQQQQNLFENQQRQSAPLKLNATNTGFSGGLSFQPNSEPLPTSVQELAAQLHIIQIEKQHADSLLESFRKRYEEEIAAIEQSYKNRLQIVEESNQKSEGRLRSEMERLMEEHLAKVKRMEQDKASLAADNYQRLEEQERTFALQLEQLKDRHRQAVLELKRDHEEAQQRLLEAKNKEIQKVASSHDTSKSLTAAVELIENNARDLGQLQMKMDEWNRSGLDEREILLRSKDEQLKMLQVRLKKQEEDNEKERHRLEDLIARMEAQNRDQLRQIDEERWKLKQDQSRVEAQLSALDSERRTFTELQTRERQSLERARDMFLEEQQSGLSHLTDERRSLAEERSKLNMEQKLHRERLQQDAIRMAQTQAEYEVLAKTIAEEKAQHAERLRELRREEERIAAERDRFHERTAALEQEKVRLERMAHSLKQRSADLDAISEEANHAHSSSERAVAEVKLRQNQLDQQQASVEALQVSVKQVEEHIAQEKLHLAKDKKDLENLKQAGLCFNCNNMLQAGTNQLVQRDGGNILAGIPLGSSPLMGPVYHHHRSNLQGLLNGNLGITLSSVAYETVASSIANDRSVRLWKIQAIKDQEYLAEESMFLEGLKHSPYYNGSKT